MQARWCTIKTADGESEARDVDERYLRWLYRGLTVAILQQYLRKLCMGQWCVGTDDFTGHSRAGLYINAICDESILSRPFCTAHPQLGAMTSDRLAERMAEIYTERMRREGCDV